MLAGRKANQAGCQPSSMGFYLDAVSNGTKLAAHRVAIKGPHRSSAASNWSRCAYGGWVFTSAAVLAGALARRTLPAAGDTGSHRIYCRSQRPCNFDNLARSRTLAGIANK